MKKVLYGLVMILAISALTGCSFSFKADDTTVYVKKNGSVIGAVIEKFDKSYYSQEDLEKYVKEKVSDYNGDKEEEPLKLISLKVSEKKAKLYLQYNSYKDYGEFNEVDFFAGTIEEAQKAGYEFDEEFYEIDDNVSTEVVEKSHILEDKELKVVITEENDNVKVSGEVLYTSGNQMTILDKGLVQIGTGKESEEAESSDAKSLSYIIYK